MSASRPSEADVEAIVEVIVGHQRIPTYRGNAQRCVGCDHLRDETDGPNSPRHARHVAEQIIASDWLAALDTEHEREVAALRAEVDDANEHAIECERIGVKALEDRILVELERDEARRALADLRGEIKALADEWEAIDGEPATGRDLAVMTVWNRAGRQVRALLPRDDAAGAGGAR